MILILSHIVASVSCIESGCDVMKAADGGGRLEEQLIPS